MRFVEASLLAKFLLISFRYFLQAEDELDCNWLFMKGQEDDESSWFAWLANEL